MSIADSANYLYLDIQVFGWWGGWLVFIAPKCE